jgi:hypothetical protein
LCNDFEAFSQYLVQKDGAAMTELKSSFLYDDLLAYGRSELFGPGNAQLPLPPMLMFAAGFPLSGAWRTQLRSRPD